MSELVGFQIVGPATYQPQEEYQKFTSTLASSSGLALMEAEGNTYHLIARDRVVGTVSLADYDDMSDDGMEKRPLLIDLQVPRTDRNVAQFVRAVLAKSFKGYSFYSDSWNCLMPIDPNLLSFEINPLDNEIDIAIRDRQLIPRFLFVPTQATYAEAVDGTIHAVNSTLVTYFVREAQQSLEIPADFSYPVAPSLQRFCVLFNHGLIPVMFYEYWQKSLKIINHSFFELDRISRKVFIKPIVFDLEATSSRLHPAMTGGALAKNSPAQIGQPQSRQKSGIATGFHVAAPNTSIPASLILRPGATLSQLLVNFLSKDLRIADDFARALVLRDINFQRDVDGVLTPQLIVHVFLDRITDRERLNDLFNAVTEVDGEGDGSDNKIIN